MIPFAKRPISVPVQALPENSLFGSGLRFSVLRLDLLHPEISGNKWFKLQGYLALAASGRKDSLVSFGGAYSNHLVALAAAGRAAGYHTTGIVRGESPVLLSPSLIRMQELGMQLQFADRQTYRRLQLPENIAALHAKYPNAVLIPEGGSGETGVDGAAKILQQPGLKEFTHICVAMGTGTTLAGLVKGSDPGQQIIGVSVLHGTSGFEPLEEKWISSRNDADRIRIVHGFDHGGYAKYSPALLSFMNSFYDRFQIPSDFVYTGKLFFAMARLSTEDYFPAGSNVLMIHSGGLQGNQSLPADCLHFNRR